MFYFENSQRALIWSKKGEILVDVFPLVANLFRCLKMFFYKHDLNLDSVNLLYRPQRKQNGYVWNSCKLIKSDRPSSMIRWLPKLKTVHLPFYGHAWYATLEKCLPVEEWVVSRYTCWTQGACINSPYNGHLCTPRRKSDFGACLQPGADNNASRTVLLQEFRQPAKVT